MLISLSKYTLFILWSNWNPMFTYFCGTRSPYVICCILCSQVFISYETRMIMGKFLCMEIAYLGNLSTPTYHLQVQDFATGHSLLNSVVFKNMLATWLLILWCFYSCCYFFDWNFYLMVSGTSLYCRNCSSGSKGSSWFCQSGIFFIANDNTLLMLFTRILSSVCQCYCKLRINP